LVEAEHARAVEVIARLDPVRYTREHLGQIALADLFSYLTPSARSCVYCGWASVYGFIPQDGAVNFVHTDEGGHLAVYSDTDPGWINKWRPYQVLDPFVYIATGLPAGLRPVPDPGLTP
jgi:hypothetical protein